MHKQGYICELLLGVYKNAFSKNKFLHMNISTLNDYARQNVV